MEAALSILIAAPRKRAHRLVGADVPLRRPQKRARLEDARAAARPENRDAALEDLQTNMVQRRHKILVRTWATCPWPVSADALRKAGYSSVKLYFQAAMRFLVLSVVIQPRAPPAP